MDFDLGDLNWLAVIVAALAYFVIGAVWYAPPVLGNVWAQAGGIAMPEPGQRPNPTIYAVPLIGSVLSAIVLGILVDATGADGVGDGFVLGLAIAVGFAMPIALVTATFETNKPKPYVWGAVNAGYHVVGNIVAALILASWT
jgi:hypothetical protein